MAKPERPRRARVALREVWTNVSGYDLSDLRELAAYPDEPVVTEVIDSLQTPANWHNYYGQRLRALVQRRRLVPIPSRFPVMTRQNSGSVVMSFQRMRLASHE